MKLRQRLSQIIERNKYNPIIKIFILLIAIILIDWISDYLRILQRIPFLPNSILTLDSNWWYAMGFTAGASLFVYLMARIVGYTIGMLTGIAYLSGKSLVVRSPIISVSFYLIYNFIYITPFAITVSVMYTTAFKLQLGLPATAIFLLCVAAVSLPGYKIFKSVYSAISNPKEDNKYLCYSLYVHGVSKNDSFLYKIISLFRERWILAKRLCDCEYHNFNESVLDAFHLSVISVVIIEMIIPNFYEHFSPGTYQPYYGGIGRMIINAQQSLSWEQIFGILWVVGLWDWFITQLITSWNYYVRDRHYQSPSSSAEGIIQEEFRASE